MKKSLPSVEIRVLKPGNLHGFSVPAPADRRAAVASLSTRYHSLFSARAGHLLPLYVLSTPNILFFGGPKPHESLESFSVPGGPYARIVVRPKYGLFWAKAIAEARAFLLSSWLPASPYAFKNLEFEYHSESSTSKSPSLELFFALEKKS